MKLLIVFSILLISFIIYFFIKYFFKCKSTKRKKVKFADENNEPLEIIIQNL